MRKHAKKVEFDLTPMIDVVFLLLIFFIITMKFKQEERRQGADLPLDEGPTKPQEAEKVDQLTLRLHWDQNTMTYVVTVNASKDGPNINGGSLDILAADRKTTGNPFYSGVFNQVVDAMDATLRSTPSIKKIELSFVRETQVSSRAQIEKSAPWGFVTLAIDACTQINQRRTERGEEIMKVTFKNLEAGSGTSRKPAG